MKKHIFLMLGTIALILGMMACEDDSGTGPDKTDGREELGKGILINVTETRPQGIDTLYINTGDTVQLTASTILVNPPEYSWESADANLLQVKKESGADSIAYAIAIGDSGTATSLKIIDSGNNAEKIIPVKIVKFWADPDFYDYLGSLQGHHYYISKNIRTWTQAKTLCEEAGGHLVSINSAEENDLLDKGRKGLADDVWIGIKFYRENKDAKWKLDKWVTGEELDYENFTSKPGDPGIFMEIYFHMDTNGRWENWHEMNFKYFLEME